jgi:hypothetical protein
MAEVVGVLASGIAVAQLASGIVSSVQKTRALWTSLSDSPKQVADSLREIELLGKVIAGLDIRDHGAGVGQGEEALNDALRFCEEVVGGLEGKLLRLGLGQGKKHQSWARVKFLVKEKEVQELVGRLERAKSMLGLAVNCHSM